MNHLKQWVLSSSWCSILILQDPCSFVYSNPFNSDISSFHIWPEYTAANKYAECAGADVKTEPQQHNNSRGREESFNEGKILRTQAKFTTKYCEQEAVAVWEASNHIRSIKSVRRDRFLRDPVLHSCCYDYRVSPSLAARARAATCVQKNKKTTHFTITRGPYSNNVETRGFQHRRRPQQSLH